MAYGVTLPMSIIDWNQIDTLFLDMDGTLLDLHFDNHFWLEHVPKRYAEANDISLEAAREKLHGSYRGILGTWSGTASTTGAGSWGSISPC